jgi:hypothetical protein
MISSPPLTDTGAFLSYWAATGFEQVQLDRNYWLILIFLHTLEYHF